MKLNLGSADRFLPGYTNVDLYQYGNVDVVTDLSQRWPWEDSVADEILAHDIIEHLPDKIHTMNEAHRVLRRGGLFDIVVPTTDGRGAFQDPTHVSFWNRNSFFYFCLGVPEFERFAVAYGITAKFIVLSAKEELLTDHVTKLQIRLSCMK
jgi:SAM-dependent methyltransferase